MIATRAFFVAFICIAIAAARGDVLYLKDGTTVTGTLKRADDGWVVQSDGKSIHVLSSQVASIEVTASQAASPKEAMDRLVSLRHSVDGLSDLNEIMTRYQRFLDNNNDPAATAEAKKDLAGWQDFQKQKLVKVGSKWVTADEKVKLVEKAAASAENARQLMKQGRMKEADPVLIDVLTADPTNATALYLNGLLRYQQDQIIPAHKAFEAASAIIPNHAPSLNNLAVVMWRQRQFVPALSDFDDAMLSSPVDKLILDNVAVALQTLPPELSKSQIALKTVKLFNEQDQQLSEAMARQGMRRFGSLWVSDQDIARWKQDEKDAMDKLDQMSGDFDRCRQKIDQLGQTISDQDAQIHRIEAASSFTDPRTGVQTNGSYPQSYYDLQRERQNAQRDRDLEIGKLDQIKKQATDLQNTRPSQKSRGVMRLVGPEGSPVRVVIAPPIVAVPATQPAK